MLRLDGKPIGRVGLKAVVTQALLTTGTSVDWPVQDARVCLIVSNLGNAAGAPGGKLQVRPYPSEDAGFTGSNGAMVGFEGAFQCDERFPWTGAVRISSLVADTYVSIMELYDGG